MISNNRYCHDTTADHFKISIGGNPESFTHFTTFASIAIPQSIYTHHSSLLQMTIHEFWPSLIHIKIFLCIYFFQLMFYTLSIAVTAVFDFALSSLLRIMMLLHPSGRQSINLAPSSSWFQQIPFWFQGYTFWDLLDKHLVYLPPT